MTTIHMALPDGWYEAEHNEQFVQTWEQNMPGVPIPRAIQHRDGRTCLLGREPYGKDDWRWHISVRSGDPGRDGRPPNWDELVDAAHSLRPGVPFVLGIPPRSFWMNLHPHVLHLVETKDEAMIQQWKANATGQPPT